jgi:hypothetical protein
VLLYGPSGCGKSYAAECAFKALGATETVLLISSAHKVDSFFADAQEHPEQKYGLLVDDADNVPLHVLNLILEKLDEPNNVFVVFISQNKVEIDNQNIFHVDCSVTEQH